jgi:hypothetical protein
MSVAVFGQQTRGNKGRAVLSEESDRIQAGRLVRVYENHEFLIPSPVANVSIKTVVNHAIACSCARASGAFGVLSWAQRLSIRNTEGNATISIRLNDPTGDVYTIDPGEVQDWDWVQIFDIFFTNATGIAIALKVAMG